MNDSINTPHSSTKSNKSPFIKKILSLPSKAGKWLWSTPIGFKIAACLAVISGILHLGCYYSSALADFMIRSPNAIVRFLLAKLTGFIPFSVAEMVIILLPLIVITMLTVCYFISTKGDERTYKNYLCFLLSVLFIIYSLFVLTLAPGYRGSTLASKLSLDQKAVSGQELYDTSLWLLEKIDSRLDSVDFESTGSSVMPYSLYEMNDKLIESYSRLADKYHFIPHLSSRLKFIILSEPMTYPL